AADPDHQARALAMRALAARRADSAGLRTQSLETLLAGVRDTHPHVRINALRNLPGYDAPDRTLPPLRGLIADPDPNTRVAAVQALAECDESAAATALFAAATDASQPLAVRTTALTGLLRRDTAAAVEIAAGWATDVTPDAHESAILRLFAARTLAADP